MSFIKCPKCNSGKVTISEHFTYSSSIFLENGVAVYTAGADGGQSQGKFSGDCRGCGHSWAARYETGQAAIEAAHLYEQDRN